MDAITTSADRQGSPELFRLLADNIPQLAWIADADGYIFWYNRRWHDYTGCSLAEMEGWGWQSVHHPDHVDAVTERFRSALTGGQAFEDVFPLRRHDGVFRKFLTRAEPIRDERGTITHWFGTNTDVTDQLETEKELREAEERVGLALAAGAIIGTWDWDLTCDRFTVDQQFATNFGLDPKLGRSGLSLEQVIETVHPDDKPGLEAAIAEVIGRGGAYAHEYRVRRADGNYYWIEANGRVDYADGKPVRFPGVLLDVEERRRVAAEKERVEQALREANRRFEAVLDNTKMAVFLMDDRQHCVYANASAEQLTGFSFEQMQGRPLHDVIHNKKPDGSHYPLEECPIDRAFPERAQTEGEELFVAPDGSLYPVAFTASPVLDDHGNPIGTVIEARNIEEERAQQAALAESEARFRTTAEATPGMLFVTDAQGNNLYVNNFYREYIGLPEEEVLGDWSRWVHPDDLPSVQEVTLAALADGRAFECEYRVRRADGEWRWNASRASASRGADGTIEGWVGVTFDIHDRRTAEEQVRTSAKELEAIYASAPVGLTVLDRDLRYVRINEQLARMNELPPADHIGRTIRDVLPEAADEMEAVGRRVLAGEEFRGLEFKGERADAPGIVRTFRANWLPIRDAAGAITGIAISAEEVTDEKAAESRRREAEERFRSIFNSAAVGIGRVSPEGPFLEVNDRYCEILGRSREEVLGGGWAEITHPDDLEGDMALVNKALSGEHDSYTLEKRYLAKDGSEIWVNLTVSVERDADGSVRFFIAVVEDIAERKAAEAALKASEERYRALFESMEQGFCVIQVSFDEQQRPSDYRFTEINPAFSRQTGLAQDVLYRPVSESVPGLERTWFERYGKIAATGVSERFVDYAEPLNRWFECYAFRIGAPEERNVAILFSDVTDRIGQEEALRNSERELRLRLNAIPQMVWSTRPDGYHDFYNDRWYEFTGTPLGSTDGEGWNGMFHPEDQPRAWERWRRSLATGEPYEIEYRLRYHNGTYRWVLGRALPIRDESGAIIRWMGTCTDIDDRIAAEHALQESEARMRAVIDAAPVGLVFSDAHGRITGGNAQVEALMGHPVLPSQSFDEWGEWISYDSEGRRIDPRTYPLVPVLLEGKDRAELDTHWQRGDGTRRWLKLVASPIRDGAGQLLGGVVASIDIDAERKLTETLEREVEKVIAEREAAQEALRQSQKLEAMGQLTGGVAHDFNNLLTPIIGSLDLLQRKQVLDERTGRLVDGALASAEKARTLVQRLLAFARRQPLQPQAIDLGRIVREMSDLVSSTSGPRVRVEVAVPDDLPPALADGNQLEMALLNLAVNARDAMPEGGTLTVAARHESDGKARPVGLKPGPHLVLSVTDTGVGMDEETRRRAIEPFFSTKGIGKGTGLGLSMVHGLAAQLGGALDIRSAPGMGTSVELWLPVASGRINTAGSGPDDVERRGAGTALLVDDEELVRASTAGMLADLGFAVEEAADGEEALRRVRAGFRPDILVTDQLMPGLSGTDLAVRLRETIPDLPVLIVSGYADLESLSPSFPHLSKPFRQAELAAALEKVKS